MNAERGSVDSNDAGARAPLREAIRCAHRCDEPTLIATLVREVAALHDHDAAQPRAVALVERQRDSLAGRFGFEHLLREFSLQSDEGLRLMCLAEAYLRIPDAATAGALIRDKIGGGDWAAHAGQSDSTLVNAAAVALSLSRRLIEAERGDAAVGRILARGGEVALRAAVSMAMRLLGDQFVFAGSIEAALERASHQPQWRHSFDMLGEAARTAADAVRYFDAYRAAIDACGAAAAAGDETARPSVSIKLSALHPRYEEAQRARVLRELGDRLVALCVEARRAGIGIIVDAEESERLELSLDLIERALEAAELREWNGFGLAVQAYQKRARGLIDWVEALARDGDRPLAVRLVKGAYWDSEIRRTQLAGLSDYPVFTRKAATDVAYLACAGRLLESPSIRPAFATHNALSVASILGMAARLGVGADRFEFQRLHGMGEGLYDALVTTGGYACRIYAPVGRHRDLLAYLVRRLLENGANSSFVNRLADPAIAAESLLEDPLAIVERAGGRRHAGIPLPVDLHRPERRNSAGVDLHDREMLAHMGACARRTADPSPRAGPLIGGVVRAGIAKMVRNPAHPQRIVGEVVETTEADVGLACAEAEAGFADWSATPVAARAELLRAMGDRIEAGRDEYVALLVQEAGRTIADSVAEVREAVDFCRYYASQAVARFEARELHGPTGERNTLALAARGVFGCISPWNFPLAIFTGQIAAALAAGNTVVAKPAPQTPLVAQRAAADWLAAGLPPGALQLLPGDAAVGASLIRRAELGGVAFTGSVASARAIARSLAARDGPIVPLIAETGGVNSMIVDASALAEQVVPDVLLSGFDSAGQRCSALRLLWLQADIAERVIDMLCGAMDELRVGDPADPSTDIGPLIDEPARKRLDTHLASGVGRILHRARLSDACGDGWFFAPTLVEIDDPARLREEVFGPVVHVCRWQAGELDAVVDRINASGYGLTLGIHTRIDAAVEQVRRRARVGNLYVNRPMIGAVVGVQPFGGEGLSGTGPKAGGPWTLSRYACERCVSVDTTSAGGNASLLSAADR